MAEPLPCPLCGHPLYLEWRTSQALDVDSTPGTDGLIPESAHTSAWEVHCEEGHVVAVSEGGNDCAEPFTIDQIPKP